MSEPPNFQSTSTKEKEIINTTRPSPDSKTARVRPRAAHKLPVRTIQCQSQDSQNTFQPISPLESIESPVTQATASNSFMLVPPQHPFRRTQPRGWHLMPRKPRREDASLSVDSDCSIDNDVPAATIHTASDGTASDFKSVSIEGGSSDLDKNGFQEAGSGFCRVLPKSNRFRLHMRANSPPTDDPLETSLITENDMSMETPRDSSCSSTQHFLPIVNSCTNNNAPETTNSSEPWTPADFSLPPFHDIDSFDSGSFETPAVNSDEITQEPPARVPPIVSELNNSLESPDLPTSDILLPMLT